MCLLQHLQLVWLGNCCPDLWLLMQGAIPEVANCRLAMVGVLAALAAEAATGRNVFSQLEIAPLAIAATFLILTIATAVPGKHLSSCCSGCPCQVLEPFLTCLCMLQCSRRCHGGATASSRATQRSSM